MIYLIWITYGVLVALLGAVALVAWYGVASAKKVWASRHRVVVGGRRWRAMKLMPYEAYMVGMQTVTEAPLTIAPNPAVLPSGGGHGYLNVNLFIGPAITFAFGDEPFETIMVGPGETKYSKDGSDTARTILEEAEDVARKAGEDEPTTA